jgi:hypothetical protein
MLNESKHSTPNGSEYAFPVGDSPGGESGGVNAGSGWPDTPQPLAVILKYIFPDEQRVRRKSRWWKK